MNHHYGSQCTSSGEKVKVMQHLLLILPSPTPGEKRQATNSVKADIVGGMLALDSCLMTVASQVSCATTHLHAQQKCLRQ